MKKIILLFLFTVICFSCSKQKLGHGWDSLNLPIKNGVISGQADAHNITIDYENGDFDTILKDYETALIARGFKGLTDMKAHEKAMEESRQAILQDPDISEEIKKIYRVKRKSAALEFIKDNKKIALIINDLDDMISVALNWL